MKGAEASWSCRAAQSRAAHYSPGQQIAGRPAPGAARLAAPSAHGRARQRGRRRTGDGRTGRRYLMVFWFWFCPDERGGQAWWSSSLSLHPSPLPRVRDRHHHTAAGTAQTERLRFASLVAWQRIARREGVASS